MPENDITTPQPEAWPICPVVDCGDPYVLRKTMIPGSWMWQPDCKHKINRERMPIIVTADGPLEGQVSG